MHVYILYTKKNISWADSQEPLILQEFQEQTQQNV